MKERGLRCACKWKNGISSYGGDKDHREVRFWQGVGCRSLVMFEMPTRDQAEIFRQLDLEDRPRLDV